MVVGAVLLNVPSPEVIDHTPVDAVPPTLAPLSVIAEGLVDWHKKFGPPAVAYGCPVTFIVRVDVAAVQPVPKLEVSSELLYLYSWQLVYKLPILGLAVCARLLNDPPPKVIVHAPVLAPPLTLEPLSVIAEGVAD